MEGRRRREGDEDARRKGGMLKLRDGHEQPGGQIMQRQR